MEIQIYFPTRSFGIALREAATTRYCDATLPLKRCRSRIDISTAMSSGWEAELINRNDVTINNLYFFLLFVLTTKGELLHQGTDGEIEISDFFVLIHDFSIFY